jgi:hypothetical protein
MAQQHHPTIVIPIGRRRVGIDPEPAFALHLDCGTWRASCPTCGYELAEGRRQDRVEHRAARRSCPICQAQTGK